MFQVTITPAAGKRLIAKAITQHVDVKKALSSGTVVIIAGTTNGYVAEEILKLTDQSDGSMRRRFFRGNHSRDNHSVDSNLTSGSINGGRSRGRYNVR